MDRHFLVSLWMLALIPVSAIFAQDEQTSSHHNFKLGVEFGANFMSCEFAKPEQIRKNHYSSYYYRDDYYYDYSYGDYTHLRTVYLGVKPEFFVFNNRIGVASGFRFTYAGTSLSIEGNSCLWKLQEEGLNTFYVQIKDIRQNSYLLGIPLEVRFFSKKREFPVQHYLKLGTSFNYRMKSNTTIQFKNANMNKYSDRIQNQISDANNNFSAFVFAAVGFKIGRYKEGEKIPWVNIEFQFPYLLATNNSFAFTGEVGFGGGFQMSFQIPIGKSVPIGSN